MWDGSHFFVDTWNGFFANIEIYHFLKLIIQIWKHLVAMETNKNMINSFFVSSIWFYGTFSKFWIFWPLKCFFLDTTDQRNTVKFHYPGFILSSLFSFSLIMNINEERHWLWQFFFPFVHKNVKMGWWNMLQAQSTFKCSRCCFSVCYCCCSWFDSNSLVHLSRNVFN